MPYFDQKLEIIAALRERCRQCEEDLYRARVNLSRNDQRLRRAEQKPTLVNSDRDENISVLRARIARINGRLSTLREEARQVTSRLAEFTERKKLVDHLQQNLTALGQRVSSLQHQLEQLRNEDPSRPNEIKAVETELRRLRAIEEDLIASLAKAIEVVRELQPQEEEQRRRQQELQREIDTNREELARLQRELVEQLQPTFANPNDLQGQRDRAAADETRLRDDCGDCTGRLHDAIVDLYQDLPPRDAVRSLDDRTPFLLFPVRLETIFVPVEAGEVSGSTELWVRVYPDDILVHTHEKTLTDREVVAGELYWTELLSAEHLREERDHRRRAAWRHVVELFGGQRAAWVAKQTKPSDWESLAAASGSETLIHFLRTADAEFFNKLLATEMSVDTRAALQKAIDEDDGDAFSRLAEKQEWFDLINTAVRSLITTFPVQDLTTTDAWTRAPRTKLLPDRFVLLLFGTDAATPREIVGNVIPDTMFLGPDPLDSKAAFTKRPDGTLVYGSSFDWMSDFDKAVEQGMGFRVELTEQEARFGFAKVLVLGLFLSANANDSAGLLEELIDNHQYSPKGFSIVPQGTPTNNTERDGTGYSDNDSYNDLAFFTAIDPPAFDPTNPDPQKSQTDGRRLADALGVSYAPLQTVRNANQTDLLDACSMNTALFPGTWGYWLRRWMKPVVSDEVARQTRSFFTQFVSGRGPLPAVRVGNQPYGILLTSDFSRWKYAETSRPLTIVPLFNREIEFLRALHKLLGALEQVWTNLANTLPFVGKPGTDSSDVLMQILGLHPASVEFFQRVGYSHEYLRNQASFTGNGRFAGELNSHILGLPAIARSYLQSLGVIEDDPLVRQMLSIQVLWQHYVTPLDVPNLVENKPPSETNTLTINYIDWLATTESTQKIINQDFPAAPPSALLYLMLRNAVLLQLHNGSYEWLQQRTVFEPALEQATRATTLAGIRESIPTVSKYELMGTRVEVAEPTHPVPDTTVADWIWAGPSPTEVESTFLREQKSALSNLAKLKTAQLERCLVEHLDCCSYRLDAWQTGLFAQRLQAQRGSGPNRKTGIYLGAFGWVEDLRPAIKTFLNRDDLPGALRPEDTHPILEEDDVLTPVSARARSAGSKRAGFVHAPSLNHAAAAALLRNAYLSHAKPELSELFAVNLSSERVRRAQFILEGMRNGQPIEALLGYQFERGLHDQTSESAARGDVPVLELNEFILPYRQAFKFESVEVVQTGTGAPSETIPPYSVVNGLTLSQTTLSTANLYGLAGFVSAAEAPNANQGDAILAEQDALRDTLDAVKDLLMAENAFQLARGNFDRVAAVSLAQKEAHIPPELEVIKTPRGTRFTFTNRVTLHFEDIDPLVPAGNPWPAISMSPRAMVEPGINKWLGQIVAAPENIVCEVFWRQNEEDTVKRDKHRVTVADLEVQPIDLVWLINISSENTKGATELETRIAFQYRRAHNIGDDKTVNIEFNPTLAGGELGFGQIFPLARQLRALLSQSRALHALDFLPASGGKETEIPIDKLNPKGYDVAELRGRVQSATNALIALADTIDGPTAPTVQVIFLNDPNTPGDDETFSDRLGAVFAKLEEKKLTFSDSDRVNVTFSLTDAETLHRNLRAIANFGIADAFPTESDLTSQTARTSLLARAHSLARHLRRDDPRNGVLDRASELSNSATNEKPVEQQVTLLLAAGNILFGETFNWLPKFTYHNEIDLATADADRSQLLKFAVDAAPGITETDIVDEWLQGLARVRQPLKRWEIVQTVAAALNDIALTLQPVQVPYRANDSWLAVEFPEKDPNNTDPEDPDKPFGISRDTLSIVAHGAAFQLGTRQSGLLLDDWTEEIPTAEETTGISFRFNQPNATPPQTMLLVVTPEETGSWDWDDLVGTLSDTLHRAKRRAVEPVQLEQQGMAWNAFAPATVSEFSTLIRNDISLDLMRMMDFVPLTEFYSKKVDRV